MTRSLLLGTTNRAKIDFVRAYLAPLPVHLLTPADLDLQAEVEEVGRSPEENADIKACAYFALANMPTLSTDAALSIEAFAEEKQPGVYVRRLRSTSQKATDGELLDHYVRELDGVGGESGGMWRVAAVLKVSPDRSYAHSYTFRVLFTSRRSKVLRPGAPLSSLMVDPASGRYYAEMQNHERPEAGTIRAFIERHLGELR